jgi:hypothetical protein
MDIKLFLSDKALKSKDKTIGLCNALLNNSISLKNLIEFASAEKDLYKATCIESLEFAFKTNPSIATKESLDFVTIGLTSNSPRVKWESARVIANIAHLFINELDEAVENLIANSSHKGTVVRWSAAFALGEILKLESDKYRSWLLPKVNEIVSKEEKNTIKKIYLNAIKKIK